MTTFDPAIRKLAKDLAEQCGCRTWETHKGVAIWLLEGAEIRAIRDADLTARAANTRQP